MDVAVCFEYQRVIDEICDLRWEDLSCEEMASAAWAYYYFSIQFRENLEIARAFYPSDEKLVDLEKGECDTDNLSPWYPVAEVGERMNHDEFMRRTLTLLPIEPEKSARFTAMGNDYLAAIRGRDGVSRALSIASYEDGGLERVFTAILRFKRWDNSLLRAFEHFLVEHIRFDSDPEEGHGALCRHLPPDDRVLPFWEALRQMFITFVPGLSPEMETSEAEANWAHA
jgi:hypothetical protein